MEVVECRDGTKIVAYTIAGFVKESGGLNSQLLFVALAQKIADSQAIAFCECIVKGQLNSIVVSPRAFAAKTAFAMQRFFDKTGSLLPADHALIASADTRVVYYVGATECDTTYCYLLGTACGFGTRVFKLYQLLRIDLAAGALSCATSYPSTSLSSSSSSSMFASNESSVGFTSASSASPAPVPQQADGRVQVFGDIMAIAAAQVFSLPDLKTRPQQVSQTCVCWFKDALIQQLDDICTQPVRDYCRAKILDGLAQTPLAANVRGFSHGLVACMGRQALPRGEAQVAAAHFADVARKLLADFPPN
jgi:hypothetical protein